ncbi:MULTISPECIES: LysR family transcriptional regulator [unclassified Erwinia]|uniref:LysR family transcriptional regulator n=1 Tax=unclassified Erwinia TaxID=2622719 RepID=UPI00082AFF73|nr:LysR family transcriptional regulator [Erwinia sp. ErVv1]
MFISKSMQVFITLYRQKNLKQAADQLCLTVPPVSRMLKNTEEWLGVKLFIIERNKAIPTPAAEALYKKLMPHYSLLNEILNDNKNHQFTISSSLTHSSFFSYVMQPFIKKLSTMPRVKFSSRIYHEDDVYVSFCQMQSSDDFLLHHFILPCVVCCTPSVREGWKQLDLVVDHSLLDTDEFQNIVLVLRNEGFEGKIKQIDNADLQLLQFKQGECIMLNVNATHPDAETILPFNFSLSLYIYINQARKMPSSELMLDYLSHEIVGL